MPVYWDSILDLHIGSGVRTPGPIKGGYIQHQSQILSFYSYWLFKLCHLLVSSYLYLDFCKHFFLVFLIVFLYVCMLFAFILISEFSRPLIPSVLSSLLSLSLCPDSFISLSHSGFWLLSRPTTELLCGTFFYFSPWWKALFLFSMSSSFLVYAFIFLEYMLEQLLKKCLWNVNFSNPFQFENICFKSFKLIFLKNWLGWFFFSVYLWMTI